MASQEHLDVIMQGKEIWNDWRERNPTVTPILTGANLENANLAGANLTDARLVGASLCGTDLEGASLENANLKGAELAHANFALANLTDAFLTDACLVGASLRGTNLARANLEEVKLSYGNLVGANLVSANLSYSCLVCANLAGAYLTDACLKGVNLYRANLGTADLARANFEDANLEGALLAGADLTNANFAGASLTHANLNRTRLVDTNFERATLNDCSVYGCSAWNVRLDGASQRDLIITHFAEPKITVDNLEVAQFIYLLLNNERIREVINTITSKVVLILGRFTNDRKAVLDAIRKELRNDNWLPVLCDFENPASRDITETVSTLAHMARFVIADITDAKSIPQELMAIVPRLPSLPVQPILLATQEEYGMFEHFRRYPWVLKEFLYDNEIMLLASLKEKVVSPAEAKARELATKASVPISPQRLA